jgi:hypothetical protein
MLSLPLLYARPILELLLLSTRVILVERLVVTSVAVALTANPGQNIFKLCYSRFLELFIQY